MRRLGPLAVVVAAAASTIMTACGGTCMRTGPSAVRLTVPVHWDLEAFCVDANCLAPSELTRLDSMYVIEVSDEASTYRYRVEVRSPDGTLVAPQGEVTTIGNRLGGETCRPTMFGAGVTIDETGRVTIDQP